jgi:hypothetical protein
VLSVVTPILTQKCGSPYHFLKKGQSPEKKMTTRKTIVGVTENKRILFMTPTKSGRRHDKRLTDKFSVVEHVPSEVTVWADTGFQGIQKIHENRLIPKKASKNHPITPEERQENRVISHFRIKVEHALAGMKRMNAASDIYRNHLPNLDDTFSLLSSGIWNFHLQRQTK